MADKSTNPVVLVVEDETALLQVITAKLEKNGCESLTAKSVAEAEQCLAGKKQVDAIWLDHYLLGGENGLDLVVKIKADDSAWKDIPIFVVSNTASNDKVRSYLELGVKNYFIKAENRLDDIITAIRTTIGAT
jgi:CheY-like chemotaxis protein